MSSPKIVNMRWGSVDVEKIGNDGKPVPGEIVTYRDVKIWPGGSRGWDWNETGESHRLLFSLFWLSIWFLSSARIRTVGILQLHSHYIISTNRRGHYAKYRVGCDNQFQNR